MMRMADFLDRSIGQVDPDVNIGRSTFTGLSYGHKTTMDSGMLVPLYFEEILSGDTFSIDTSMFIRMATPIYPVMDNAYFSLFYFYVPYRLVWDNYKQFLGENKDAPWVNMNEYTVPQIRFGVNYFELSSGRYTVGCVPGSIMNYFGIPCSMYPEQSYYLGESSYDTRLTVSDLPHRAYRLIWNEFFRSEAIEYPVPVYTDDSTRDYNWNSDPTYDYGGHLLPVNRFFDYFSGALPAPQAGPSVSAGIIDGDIPVIPKGGHESNSKISGFQGVKNAYSSTFSGTYSDGSMGNVATAAYNNVNESKGVVGTIPSGNSYFYSPTNLFAVASQINIASVNQLREAFAVQRWYEKSARGGQRYREVISNFFGVTVPDSRVQIPEYLGGCEIPINMDQVLQTSSTDNTSPQGNTAGYSLTTNVDNSFTKSFVEPGMLIGLGAIRVSHTYSQSVRPFWYRKRRFDFYWPQFASLGEQPILKKFICPTGIESIDSSVFGYQEAFADYRHHPNMLSGQFSPTVVFNDSRHEIEESQSQLAQAWTYSDFYSLNYDNFRSGADLALLTPPTLSKEWLNEDPVNIGQTLAVQNEPQFVCDFQFNVKATRPMPVHSIPGLLDHH